MAAKPSTVNDAGSGVGVTVKVKAPAFAGVTAAVKFAEALVESSIAVSMSYCSGLERVFPPGEPPMLSLPSVNVVATVAFDGIMI